VEWNGPAVDTRSQTIYVGSVDFCFKVKSGPSVYKKGQTYFGTTQQAIGGADAARGWIYAVNGHDGAVLWKYHADAPVVAGVTPTGGGVVFSGDLSGNLLALDAKSGAELYKLNTGGAVAGGVITYDIGGKQYVATTSGNVSRMTFTTGAGSPKVVILTTGLEKDNPKIVAVPESTPPPSNASLGAHGKALFGQYCSACHGQTGEGGVGPALKGEAAKKSSQQVVAFIKNPKAPMPKLYPSALTDGDVDALAAFVQTLN
jgi:mono/diheme cytochrome c family protein